MKKHVVIVVSENILDVNDFAKKVEAATGFESRATVLGHLQRGGRPSAYDRILASRLGAAAIDALLDEQRNIMVGVVHDDIVYVPFTKAIKDDKPVDAVLMDVLKALSC